jgi:hypothetical protein
MKMRGRVFLTAPAAIIRVNAHTTTGSHLVTITDHLGIFFARSFLPIELRFRFRFRRSSQENRPSIWVRHGHARDWPVDAGNPLAPKPTAVPLLIRIKVATRLRRSHTARRSIP